MKLSAKIFLSVDFVSRGVEGCGSGGVGVEGDISVSVLIGGVKIPELFQLLAHTGVPSHF